MQRSRVQRARPRLSPDTLTAKTAEPLMRGSRNKLAATRLAENQYPNRHHAHCTVRRTLCRAALPPASRLPCIAQKRLADFKLQGHLRPFRPSSEETMAGVRVPLGIKKSCISCISSAYRGLHIRRLSRFVLPPRAHSGKFGGRVFHALAQIVNDLGAGPPRRRRRRSRARPIACVQPALRLLP